MFLYTRNIISFVWIIIIQIGSPIRRFLKTGKNKITFDLFSLRTGLSKCPVLTSFFVLTGNEI